MPSKITHLTDEQKARFPEWVKRWTDIGLTTGKADRELFERSARACLRLAGENDKVPIIWVSSPIVGAFASSLSALVLEKLRREKVIPREGKAVLSAVDSAVRSAVYSAVHSSVYSVVHSAVDSAVLSSVDSAVLSSVRSAVRSAVLSSVDSAVLSSVDLAVDSSVRSAVGLAVLSSVHSSVYSAVHSAVGLAVLSSVHSSVGSAVDSAVDSAVLSAVDLAVDSAVKSAKGLFWHYWMGGQLWSGWTAFVSYLVQVANWTPCKDILDRIDAYEGTVRSACYWWPNKDFIMVCERPVEIHRNDRGQLHNSKGKAISWPDGWGLWTLNGINVPEWVVTTEAGQIDPRKALEEKNVDVQRELIRKIGAERMLKACNAKCVDTFLDKHTKSGNVYKLMEMKFGGINRKYLYYEHASLPGVFYAQPVPPTTEKALHARAWMLGIDDPQNMNDEVIKSLLPMEVA